MAWHDPNYLEFRAEINKRANHKIKEHRKLILVFVGFIVLMLLFARGIGGSLNLASSWFELLGPTISGILIGVSSELYTMKYRHDSVLRYALVCEDRSAHKMRFNFCAIVNEKLPMLNVDGFDVNWLDADSRFYQWLLGIKGRFYSWVFLLILIPCIVYYYFIAGDSSKLLFPLHIFLMASSILLYAPAKLMLKRKTHTTVLRSGNKDHGFGWVVIRGERADDGMPTKNFKVIEMRSRLPAWKAALYFFGIIGWSKNT